MAAIISVWKQIGETPLQAMERARKEYHLENLNPACFTGRLDPMAQGVLINLFGDAVKEHQDTYNASNKVYRFHAVLGISTTSYDPMGSLVDIQEISNEQALKFHNKMLNMKGKFIQAFPPCSSMRYKGRPLWWHSKHGSLPTVLPCKEREIFEVRAITPPVSIPVQAYRRGAISDIKDVIHFNGDKFNGDNIIREWRQLNPNILLWRVQYEVSVSSGTYIRSLVHDLGQQIGIPAHASRITRMSLKLNLSNGYNGSIA
jgi:tRNA pseudouridine55 synthase